jgi:hypothetical protein
LFFLLILFFIYFTSSSLNLTTPKMPLGTGLGLAYTRANGSGHMVVLAKNDHGIVKCIDYQQNPPAIADFPPEENIVSVHVFYKQP